MPGGAADPWARADVPPRPFREENTMQTTALRAAGQGGLCAALLAATMLAGTPAFAAQTLRFAGGWPPNSGPDAALQAYAARVGELSGGALKMKIFPLTLLSFAEANSGVKDGIADAAAILTPYFAAEFPTLNMISEFSTLVELPDYSSDLSSLAFAAAVSEYVMMHCPACEKELAAQNEVYMGAGMTTSYALQCTVPLAGPADLSGKRIRAGGAYWARWAEAMGATPVSISINETFEALSQGVLDCTASNPAELVNFGFVDAVKHVYTGTPGGQFTVPAMMNRDTWRGLSEEGRAAVMQANATYAADMTWAYLQEARRGLKAAGEKGIDTLPAGAAMAEKSQDFIEADLTAVIDAYAEKYGVQDGAAAQAKVRELLGRWTELVKGVESVEALRELYWTEIYSKIDAKTYGL